MQFLIKFTVDEAAVGHVLAALNSHDGVVFDHLEIVPLAGPPRKADLGPEIQAALKAGEKAAAKKPAVKPSRKDISFDEAVSEVKRVAQKLKPAPRKARALGAQEHILRILSDGKPHRYTDLEKDLRSMGFKALGSTMRHLRDKGLANRTDEGLWKVREMPVLSPTLAQEA